MYTKLATFALALSLALGCAHQAATTTGTGSAAAPVIVPLERHFTNAYLVIGERVVVVDTGNPGNERHILDALAARGLSREDVSLVVVTHGHADHTGSARALHEALGAPVAMGAADLPMAARGHNDELHPTGAPGRRLRRLIRPDYPALVPDVRIEAPVDLRPYGVAGTLVPTGGHTGGSVAVVLESGDALVGDLVRGRFAARSRPTEHYFHDDVPGAHAALRALLRSPVTRVHPGHGHALEAASVRAWLDEVDPVPAASAATRDPAM